MGGILDVLICTSIMEIVIAHSRFAYDLVLHILALGWCVGKLEMSDCICKSQP